MLQPHLIRVVGHPVNDAALLSILYRWAGGTGSNGGGLGDCVHGVSYFCTCRLGCRTLRCALGCYWLHDGVFASYNEHQYWYGCTLPSLSARWTEEKS